MLLDADLSLTEATGTTEFTRLKEEGPIYDAFEF